MENLLKDQKLNELLKIQGYVVIDFLDKENIEDLKKLYHDNLPNQLPKGFHASMYHEDISYRKLIDKGIRIIIQNSLDSCLSVDYMALYANFMVKELGNESSMKLHQDWAYVNEVESTSFAIWTPLMDINETNGAFHVLPYSHNIQNYVRGPGLNCPIHQMEQIIKQKYLKPIYLKAGQAIIWNHRLAHSSPANKSHQSRIAATAILVPKQQKIVHYYQPSSKAKIEEYEVDNDFYMNYAIGSRPKITKTRTFKYRFKNLNEKRLETNGSKKKYGVKSLFGIKLKKLFKHSKLIIYKLK